MAELAEHDEVAKALESLDWARKRFVAVVGHELRTPVTTLRGLAEELLQADESTLAEVAPAIVRNARRVESLLDDMLLATEITTVLPVGEPEAIDLVATAQATWDSFEPMEGEDDHGSDPGDLQLTGDAEAIALLRPGAADTMIERVLDNARRYGTPPHTLRASSSDGRVRITVSSAGAELAADDVHLAFELFYRGEGAVTTAPGFGLGLPVARALARQHGGDLTLEPHSGGGLDVTIDLPAGA